MFEFGDVVVFSLIVFVSIIVLFFIGTKKMTERERGYAACKGGQPRDARKTKEWLAGWDQADFDIDIPGGNE